jgi:DNA processing protein
MVVSALASKGVTVISGLARGIDGIAHRSALQSGGRTIAVLGSGIDLVYPSEHRRLADSIVGQGALISEYPPGTPPEGHHFPARNRIIAGLAKGVIVIEAAERSGALITANFAAEQGKEVFAVPGDIIRKTSRGTNRLIQDGAHPLINAEEVLEILNIGMDETRDIPINHMPEDTIQVALLEALGDEPAHIDELYQITGLPIAQIQAGLSILELNGWIQNLGGMQFMRLQEGSVAYCVD